MASAPASLVPPAAGAAEWLVVPLVFRGAGIAVSSVTALTPASSLVARLSSLACDVVAAGFGRGFGFAAALACTVPEALPLLGFFAAGLALAVSCEAERTGSADARGADAGATLMLPEPPPIIGGGANSEAGGTTGPPAVGPRRGKEVQAVSAAQHPAASSIRKNIMVKRYSS